MNEFERENYKDQRQAGAVHAFVGTTLGISAGFLLRSTTLATGIAVGGSSLCKTAQTISEALEADDLDQARALLPSLVGRNPSDLNETEIVRAVIESVAENTVDAAVAPALWAAATGAPGALGYRAVNTMDAMVGHHSQRYENYGWASARADDVANWVPARCTAALVALVRPSSVGKIHSAVTTQARQHPSPNSGVAEAAFAAALSIRLGGRNEYGERVEDRPVLGRGRVASRSDIQLAIQLSRDVTTALAVILGAIGVGQWWLNQ
jgi:adenosylcobinamide-phosphate synthase